MTTYAYSIDELKQAIKKDELILYYQPQVSSKTFKITGFEALVRWVHPNDGLVYPNNIIPLAEETGLIVEMGEWIIKTVCKQVKEWWNTLDITFSIAINLSIKQLSQPNLVDIVENALNESGLEPSYLELEITETATENMDLLVKNVTQLKKLGVKLSIDDFGKGFNSLYYLKEFKVDKIKLDKDFVLDIHNERDKIIVTSMISLAKELDVEVVAEGIETEEQKEIFKGNCDYLQGYYFSKPVSVEEITELLKKIHSSIITNYKEIAV